jgi:hypothetical protein
MAHIEHTRLLSRPMMALCMAKITILQRHGIARERDHFRATRDMEVV